MYHLRNSFPLHYIAFKQTASHIPHEGSVERIFSPSGHLTDPNMDPHFHTILTKISKNKVAYNHR